MLAEYIGPHKVLWATDYPHRDDAYHPSRHLPPAKVRVFLDFVLASVPKVQRDRGFST
jgi:hypothetical protein